MSNSLISGKFSINFRINEGYLFQIVASLIFSTCVTTNWKLACINQGLLHVYGLLRLESKFGTLSDIYYPCSVLALIFFTFGSFCYSQTCKDEFIANYNNKNTLKGQKEILNSLPEGVLIADIKDAYKYLNPKIKQTFSLSEFCQPELWRGMENEAQEKTMRKLDQIIQELEEKYPMAGKREPGKCEEATEFLDGFLGKFTATCQSLKENQPQINYFNQLDQLSRNREGLEDRKIDEDSDNEHSLSSFLKEERRLVINGFHERKESKIKVKYNPSRMGKLYDFRSKEFLVKTTLVNVAGISEQDLSCIHMFIETTQISQLEEAKAQNHYQRQMLSNVSHEFRTPLNSIMASLELMRIQDLGECNRFVRIASSSCNVLGMLVEDILDHAKIDSGVFQINEEVFTITQCLHEIQEVFTLQADGKGLELRIDIQDKLKELPIMSDKSRLKQVIMNLVSNALKFTDRGSITIEIYERLNQLELQDFEESKSAEQNSYKDHFRQNSECGIVDLPCEGSTDILSRHDCTEYFFHTKRSIFRNDDELDSEFTQTMSITLKVIDTGIGISKADQKSLFKLFGKLSSNHNRNKTGCGLGLTICKKLIEKLDGSIHLSSIENVGTTVECHFLCKY
ncbi:unnamed protein product [Moneuplotes crassus]|uniref:histidine kinase n=1 Tax=Euplotes crassus TaxID=5936 RepID=A0AAD1Y5S5_EUPCR|nr:unnamed protein product [Moneuplotes crassus]